VPADMSSSRENTSCIGFLESLEISNQILMDLFEEQQNIVHVKKENNRKSLILEKRRDSGMLKFSE